MATPQPALMLLDGMVVTVSVDFPDISTVEGGRHDLLELNFLELNFLEGEDC